MLRAPWLYMYHNKVKQVAVTEFRKCLTDNKTGKQVV